MGNVGVILFSDTAPFLMWWCPICMSKDDDG